MTVTITHLLNRDATLQRQVATPNGQGGFSGAYQNVDTLRGRRQAASGADRLVAARAEAEVSHVWYFDAGAEVRPLDRIVSNGVTDVVVCDLPPSNPDFVKVAVKEYQLGRTA